MKNLKFTLSNFCLILMSVAQFSFVSNDTYITFPEEKEETILTTNTTKASWYGNYFHGRTTANGEKYNMYALTAAHKKLAFNTKVKITNLENKKSVIVRINDRGPYVKGRSFDLSKAAFSKIADINKGVIKISYTILKP